MELYLWNVRVSAAFAEVIALAEIILRNAMAEQLAAAYGATWYARAELFDDRTINGFRTAWRNVSMPHDRRTGKPQGKTLGTVPAGKLVAESTFGCWVNLLDKGGTRGEGPFKKNVDYDSTLWRGAGGGRGQQSRSRAAAGPGRGPRVEDPFRPAGLVDRQRLARRPPSARSRRGRFDPCGNPSRLPGVSSHGTGALCHLRKKLDR